MAEQASKRPRILLAVASVVIFGSAVYALTLRLFPGHRGPGPVPSMEDPPQADLFSARPPMNVSGSVVAIDSPPALDERQVAATAAVATGARASQPVKERSLAPSRERTRQLATRGSASGGPRMALRPGTARGGISGRRDGYDVGDTQPPRALGDSTAVMARFSAPPAAEPAPAPPKVDNLEPAPNRGEIQAIMSEVRREVQECYDRQMVPGRVDLTLVVEGSTGRVKRADVTPDSGTAECIRRVAERLEFPRFAKAEVTVRYPYSFR